jgi:hypothetical protein
MCDVHPLGHLELHKPRSSWFEPFPPPTHGQVYTPWANLKKRDDMDVGQIGYKNMKEVRAAWF